MASRTFNRNKTKRRKRRQSIAWRAYQRARLPISGMLRPFERLGFGHLHQAAKHAIMTWFLALRPGELGRLLLHRRRRAS